MNKLPKNLSKYGFNYKDGQEMNWEAIEASMDWIESRFEKSKRINTKYTSYTLKHVVESHIGRYVSNGELITAMILLGFEYRIDDFSNANCHFRVAHKSVEPYLNNTKS